MRARVTGSARANDGGQAILLGPPFRPDRRQRLAVERQVVGDQAEMIGDLAALEEMPPLRAVRARGVLQQHRDARARFLEIDAVVLTVDVEMDVASDRTVESAGGLRDGQQRLFFAGRSSSMARMTAG